MLAQLAAIPNQTIQPEPILPAGQIRRRQCAARFQRHGRPAPFDGVVTNVEASQVGSYLQASQQAFSLVSTSNVLGHGEGPKETPLTYVTPGQQATVTVDTYPGVEWNRVVHSSARLRVRSFSLLPAQNTPEIGSKSCQRIPMRCSDRKCRRQAAATPSG